MTQAEIAKEFAEETYRNAETTEDGDAEEPWRAEAIPGCEAVDSSEDDGECFTVTFGDGSKARWINSIREWQVLEESETMCVCCAAYGEATVATTVAPAIMTIPGDFIRAGEDLPVCADCRETTLKALGLSE